jgi:hypothetical protein
MPPGAQAISDVARRVVELDDRVNQYLGASIGHLADIAREFVSVTSAISFRGTPDLEAETVSPSSADAAVAQSRALHVLSEVAPWLDQGPTATSYDQRWIATQRAAWLPARDDKPSKDMFVEPAEVDVAGLLARPPRFGLFTCSATADYPGMWRTYLEINPLSGLADKPWRTWRLAFPPSIKIAQIDSAQAWANLIDQHPVTSGPWVYPDWRSIASTFDAVHLTPRAVLATEGLALKCADGLIHPTYWGVESTLWLRWKASSTEPIASDL